jgi:hypothetical protein
MKRPILFLGVAATAGACVIAAVDYTGKPCPCPTGWMCSRGVCAPSTDAAGGHDGSPPADASLDATSDALRDAPSDAGPRDGSWCSLNAPDAFFCCDFDEKGGIYSCGWFPGGTDQDATSIDRDQWSSPPASLLSRAPGPIADGGVFSSYVSQGWTADAAVATALHFAFEFLVEPVSNGPVWVTPAGLTLVYPGEGGTQNTRTVGVLIYGDKMAFQELIYADGKKNAYNQVDEALPPPGSWNRITFDVTLESDAGPATCTVTDSAGAKFTRTLQPGWTPGHPQIAVGLTYAFGPQSAPSVNIDNVTLDIR